MALRDPQPQHEILLGDGGDGFAGQYHRAGGHRHSQHAPGGRRQHFAFGNLLFDHRALGGARFQRIGRDVKGGLRCVEGGLRRRAVRKQFLARRSRSVLRLGKLGLEAGDLSVERLHLQRELFVGDGGDDLILFDMIAALHRKLHHGAADARPRRHDIGAFDGGEHGLLVGDRLRRNDERVLSERRPAANNISAPAAIIAARNEIHCLVMSDLAMTARFARIAGAVIDLPQGCGAAPGSVCAWLW